MIRLMKTKWTHHSAKELHCRFQHINKLSSMTWFLISRYFYMRLKVYRKVANHRDLLPKSCFSDCQYVKIILFVFKQTKPNALKQLMRFNSSTMKNWSIRKIDDLSFITRSTTLQSVMNAKLSKHGFWHCHENGLIKTIQTLPHNL